MIHILTITLTILFFNIASPTDLAAQEAPAYWKQQFPLNDFKNSIIDFNEIMSGGVPKDGIPAIDDPVFEPLATVELHDQTPVIGIEINGNYKAYPLRILIWHEIVNDTLGGVPITVTFCPLCNSSIVFDRRVQDGVTLDFGTTGTLRNSDLVMYDRQTETFWQQALGQGLIGHYADTLLDIIPYRLESFKNFKERANDQALVLVPNNPKFRSYGSNPYAGYDSASQPFLYNGEMVTEVPPLSRIITTPSRTYAYSLARLQRDITITTEDGILLTYSAGQSSALDTRTIADGKDVGNIVATKDGKDAVYFVEFAFAFRAFSPKGVIYP